MAPARGPGPLHASLLLFTAACVAAAALEVPFKALEVRRLLAKATDDGKLTVKGYALPPSSTHPAAHIPMVDSVLNAGDGVPILARSIADAAEELGKGEFDTVLVPILYDVDGITAGKELGGFIKLQYVSPEAVSFTETEPDTASADAILKAHRNAALSKVCSPLS